MKKIILSMSILAAGVAAAQNIDPTVEVSREYEGKLMQVHKPSLTMAVPDTLHSFDLDFDYSVFENPYKGTYDFNPYILEMRPSSSVSDAGTFYLKAGAGYTLHPTLDLVWSPIVEGPLSLDVYGRHRSYIGKYRAVGCSDEWDGFESVSKAGVDLDYDWKKAVLGFEAGYQGIADEDLRRKRNYNALDLSASLKSKSIWPENFLYDISAAYRFAEDNSSYASDSYLSEHGLKVDVTIGPNFGKKGKILFDAGVQLAAYRGASDSKAGVFYFIPRYLFKKGIFKLDAGLRICAVASVGDPFGQRGQIVYPDVNLDLDIIPSAMRLYFKVGGGERLNTYSSLLDRNNHFDLRYGMGSYASVMNVSVERVSAVVGLEGRITPFFSYNLKGGYADYKSGLFDAVIMVDEQVLPAVGYSSYKRCFAAVDWDLNLQSFNFNGSVVYTHTSDIADAHLLAPAALEGDVSAIYNWNQRIYGGLDCRFSSLRTSAAGYKVPGYADLGIYGEYVLNRRLSFWLRGGNLLNMEIQRNPLYAEKGLNFTAGICLNLQ